MASRRNYRRAVLQRRRRRFRQAGYAALLVAGLYFVFAFVWGDWGLMKYLQLIETRRGLQDEIEQISLEITSMRRQAEILRTDPDAIERIAREELGLAREGEIIYRFKEKEVRP